MIRIANSQFWVHDQDEALDFCTKTLGWEVRADVTLEAWHFRWLVVVEFRTFWPFVEPLRLLG